ncbi:MAG: hypothetical protein H6602_07760 [Flavobacteriales bacterium]|nr:hypothetical protein [Flavobacteriales bacterium]
MASKTLDDIESEVEFNREIARRDEEARIDEEREKMSWQRAQNMSAIALALAIVAIILSVVNFVLAD